MSISRDRISLSSFEGASLSLRSGKQRGEISKLMHEPVPGEGFRTITPPLMNGFIALVKDSSLVYVLGVTTTSLELTKFGRNNLDQHVNVTPLFVVGLYYPAITFPLARIVEHRRRRGRVHHRLFRIGKIDPAALPEPAGGAGGG